MALNARELLLIVRAQNQASGALRRVAGDMSRLGAIRDLHYKQNQLGINQAQLMRQRQAALNNLQSIEGEHGRRNLALQRARINQSAAEISAVQRLNLARARLASAQKLGAPPEVMTHLNQSLRVAELRQNSVAKSAQHLAARESELAQRAGILRSELSTVNQRLAQNAFQQREVAKAISQQRWERVQVGGRIMSHVGRVIQLGGLVAGGALAYMASGAAKFNSEATLVATQTGRVGTGFATIAKNSRFVQNSLLSLMGQTTATREELTQSAYDIYSSMDVSLTGGMKLLRTFSQASIAGMTPLNDVTQAGITIMNDFGISVARAPRVFQRLFAAVRFGRMTFQQFAGTMATTVPAAHQQNQSLDQMAGAMAFLTRRLGNVNRSAVGYARALEVLNRTKVVQNLKEQGIAVRDIHNRMLPLPQVLDNIIRKFPGLAKGTMSWQNFLKVMGGTEGTIQARRALSELGRDMPGFRKILRQTTGDNNEFSRSLSAMEKTTGVRWSKFVNQLRALALGLGTAVIPALMAMVGPIQDLVKWFQNLDEGTRAQIGRFAAWGAGIALLGGTIMSVTGVVISFVAALGKFGLAGPVITGMILAVIAAIKVLHGEWTSLSDVVTSFADTMTGSFTGFIAMSALVVGAILKIRSALMGLAVASAASSGAGGLAGLLGGVRGVGNAVRSGRFVAMAQAEQGAGRFTAAMRGAGVAVAALPGPLKIAAAAIGLGAGAAALWELHMRGVRDRAREAAEYQARLQRTTQAPVAAARRLGGLGQDVRDILEQRNAVASLNQQIKAQRNAVQQANAAQRPEAQRQLNSLLYERANALDELQHRQFVANKAFDQFTVAIRTQSALAAQTGGDVRRLRQLEQLKRLMDLGTNSTQKQRVAAEQLGRALGITDYGQLQRAIKGTRAEMEAFIPSVARGANVLRSQFLGVIRSFQRTGLLKPKIDAGALEASFRLAVKRGRMLTIPEIRAVIKAYTDKAALGRARRDLQNVVRGVKTDIALKPKIAKIDARAGLALAKIARPFVQNVAIKAPDGAREKAKIAKPFAKTIQQAVHIGPVSPDPIALGRDISAGIKAGVGQVQIDIFEHVHRDIQETRRKTGSRSPSRMTMRLIGIPLMAGIVAGIESQYGKLEKASQLAMDLFNGPWLTSDRFSDNAKKKIHMRFRDLIKDLRLQVQEFTRFNNSLARLAHRGAPILLLEQLAALGAEGAKKIQILARATDKQLRAYVRLWQRGMREVRRSARSNFDQIIQDLPNMLETAAQNMLAKWNEFRDNLKSGFGDLFKGLEPLVGEGLKAAQDEYKSQIEDFQSQIADLNQQIIDEQTQLFEAVRGQFGELFNGVYLQSQDIQTKLDWGIALNMNDLTRDLESQITAFSNWRSNLLKLAGMVPAGLLAELTKLGPEAAGKIATLANSTGPELERYVALWQQAQGVIGSATTDGLPDVQEFKDRIRSLEGQIAALQEKINSLAKPRALTPQDIISGAKDQLSQFKDWTGQIDALRKRNVPKELLQQIAAMGPEALPFLQGLNSMTNEQLKEYVGLWQKSQEAITAETKKLMADQIAIWRKHGSDIAIGIITGIMDEQEALLRFFRKLFNNLLREARKENKAHSPSLVFAELGRDIVDGLRLGLDQDVRVPTPRLGGAFMRGNGYQAGGSAPITMTVHAHQDESLQTTLERASFRLRNRPVAT